MTRKTVFPDSPFTEDHGSASKCAYVSSPAGHNSVVTPCHRYSWISLLVFNKHITSVWVKWSLCVLFFSEFFLFVPSLNCSYQTRFRLEVENVEEVFCICKLGEKFPSPLEKRKRRRRNDANGKSSTFHGITPVLYNYRYLGKPTHISSRRHKMSCLCEVIPHSSSITRLCFCPPKWHTCTVPACFHLSVHGMTKITYIALCSYFVPQFKHTGEVIKTNYTVRKWGPLSVKQNYFGSCPSFLCGTLTMLRKGDIKWSWYLAELAENTLVESNSGK